MKTKLIMVLLILVSNTFLFGQISSSKSLSYVNSYHNIDNIDSDNFSDLSFLDSLVMNKRIVFLGESHHGINDFNIFKYRLIRYLHEKHGFEVVAFESGIGSCGVTNLVKDSLSGMEMLVHSLMGIWRVKGNCEMMDYIKCNKMELAGIDPNNAALDLNYRQYNYILKNDLLAKQFVTLDSILLECFEMPKLNWYQYSKPFDRKLLDSIAICLKTKYAALHDSVLALPSISRIQKEILLKAIESRQLALSTSDNRKSINYFITDHQRDSLMAHNVEYLLDTLYRGKKIIIWAHNVHIGKTGTKNINGNASIGMYLPKRIIDESFIVGLYAINGEFSLGMSEPLPINNKRNSFENKFKNINCKAIYISTNNTGSEEILAGKPSRKVVLQKMYDGVILINNVNASHLIHYNKEFKCE